MSFDVNTIMGDRVWISPADFYRLYTCQPSGEPRFPLNHADFVRYREEMRTAFERVGFSFDCHMAKESGYDHLSIVNRVTGRSFSYSYQRQNRYGAMMQMHHQWVRFCELGADKW